MQSLVGGEPARLLLDTIRGFPLTVSGGRVKIDQVGDPTGLAAVHRAFEVVELQVIVDAEHCREPHTHGTLHEEEFRHLVLREIVRQAKRVLGEIDVLDPIWESHLRIPKWYHL